MNTHIQNALNGVLNNRKVLNVLIWTNIIRNFEIVNKRCKNGIFAANIPKVKITNIGKNAVNTKLTAEVPVKADLSANTTVTLAEDAKNSEITLSKKVDVEVKAADAEKAVEDVTINVAKEAEGASLKTEVKAEIKAEANVSITLDKTAQDSTVIVTDENVKVEVEKTDEDGNVSKEEITSTPIPAPDTTTPSTPSTPSVPSTPKPEEPGETPVPTVTASLTTVTLSAVTAVEGETNTYTVNATIQKGANVTFTVSAEGYTPITTENISTETTTSVELTANGKNPITVKIVTTIAGDSGTVTPPVDPVDPEPETLTVTLTNSTPKVDGGKYVTTGSAVTASGSAVDVNPNMVVVSITDNSATVSFNKTVGNDTVTAVTGTVTITFTATVKDASNNPVTNATYTWTGVSSNTDTATVTIELSELLKAAKTYSVTATKAE